MVQSSPTVVIDRLRVTRGGNVVLPGLSLDVQAGRITGLLGPSGCGKSTLMRAIVGVQRIESGTVGVLGEPAGSPALRRRVAYATQVPSLYPELTASENLSYFRRILGLPAEAVERAIRSVGIEDVSNRPVRSLSGGQRGSVSLAAALLGEPEVLVLDEPTVGVDPILRREIWELLKRLASEGATLFISSHVMDEADRCDDLILMRDGQVIAVGTPAELRSRAGAESIEDAFLRFVEQDER